MTGDDLAPVAPYPGYPGQPAVATPPASAERRPRPVIAPAEPEWWSTTVALAYPLLVDGERLDVLTVRRLTGRDIADLLIADDDETSLNARARALMAGVHPDVLEALAADDAEALAAACRPFLPAALVAIEDRIRADLAAMT